MVNTAATPRREHGEEGAGPGWGSGARGLLGSP